jgi:protein-S-isoprenylcysteine O-methyltransferase Ste14
MKNKPRRSSATRGGGWVLIQFPLLVLAYLIPQWTGGPFGLDRPLQWLGASLLALGVLLTVLGMAALGRYLTPFPRPLAQARFRRTGAYGVVRHPIYSGIVLAAAGWSLLWLSAAGVVFALMLGVFFDRKAAREEAWLQRKFKPYRAYQRRVKKLIPWVY